MKLTGNDKRILWSLFFIIWTIIWIRAAAIPVFPDEVFSWFLYGESGHFFPPRAQLDANNHFVNSILTFLSARIFGVSALTIRIPNVLGFVLFFYAAVGISRFQGTKAGFYISLISLTGVFYVLEFFSLSRGYGLSIAFLLWSVLLMMKFQRNLTTRTLLLTGLSMILALGSNLSLLFTYAALLVWIAALVIWKKKELTKSSFRSQLIFIVLFGGIFFMYFRYTAHLNEAGMLYYGRTENFPLDTLFTLFLQIFEGNWQWLYYMISVFSILLVLSIILLAFRNNIASFLTNPRFVFPVLFLATITGITLAVLVMKTPAPSDRTALHLIPLFTGSLVFLFPSFDRKLLISYLQLAVLVFPAATLWRISLNSHAFWKDDQLSSGIYDKLEQEMKTAQKPIVLSGFHFFDRIYAFNYVNRKGKIPEFDLSSWDSGQADLMLLRKADLQHPATMGYTVIATDPVSGNSLLKRKDPATKKLLKRFYKHIEPGNSEFLDFLYLSFDSLNYRNLVANIDFRMAFEESGEAFVVVAAISDSAGHPIRMTDQLRLNQLMSDWTKRKRAHLTIPFYNIPPNAADVKIYIYNSRKVKYDDFKAITSVYSVDGK